MTRLISAEVRKLATTGLWLWIGLAAAVWSVGYTVLAIGFSGRVGGLTPRFPARPGSMHCLRSAPGAPGRWPPSSVPSG